MYQHPNCPPNSSSFAVDIPPRSPVRMDSINEQTYRGILYRQDSSDARRTAGILEESITAYSRHRYASNSKDDNLLNSLAISGYIEGASVYSLPSENSLDDKKEEDVRNLHRVYYYT